MEPTLIISPKTKVLQLIETYPQLEQLLIELVPVFVKLKNPILRNTVAKITTLQQAAAIGDVKAEELINILRKAVGQESLNYLADSGYNIIKPKWFDNSKIAQEFDVREMLNAGEHPVNQVIADLKQMEEGKIYLLIAPFLTAPLIDKASSINFQHWVNQTEPELYKIYFCKV